MAKRYQRKLFLISVASLLSLSLVEQNDRKYAEYFFQKFSAELYKERAFHLSSMRISYSCNAINLVSLRYSCFRPLDVPAARDLMLSVIEELLKKANTNDLLKTHNLLKSSHLCINNLDIEIRSDSYINGLRNSTGVAAVRLEDNVITYETYKTSPYYVEGRKFTSESYREALMLTSRVPGQAEKVSLGDWRKQLEKKLQQREEAVTHVPIEESNALDLAPLPPETVTVPFEESNQLDVEPILELQPQIIKLPPEPMVPAEKPPQYPEVTLPAQQEHVAQPPAVVPEAPQSNKQNELPIIPAEACEKFAGVELTKVEDIIRQSELEQEVIAEDEDKDEKPADNDLQAIYDKITDTITLYELAPHESEDAVAHAVEPYGNQSVEETPKGETGQTTPSVEKPPEPIESEADIAHAVEPYGATGATGIPEQTASEQTKESEITARLNAFFAKKKAEHSAQPKEELKPTQQLNIKERLNDFLAKKKAEQVAKKSEPKTNDPAPNIRERLKPYFPKKEIKPVAPREEPAKSDVKKQLDEFIAKKKAAEKAEEKIGKPRPGIVERLKKYFKKKTTEQSAQRETPAKPDIKEKLDEFITKKKAEQQKTKENEAAKPAANEPSDVTPPSFVTRITSYFTKTAAPHTEEAKTEADPVQEVVAEEAEQEDAVQLQMKEEPVPAQETLWQRFMHYWKTPKTAPTAPPEKQNEAEQEPSKSAQQCEKDDADEDESDLYTGVQL